MAAAITVTCLNVILFSDIVASGDMTACPVALVRFYRESVESCRGLSHTALVIAIETQEARTALLRITMNRNLALAIIAALGVGANAQIVFTGAQLNENFDNHVWRQTMIAPLSFNDFIIAGSSNNISGNLDFCLEISE